jgi:conserved oligomeric Golgi complex subunit 7
VKKQLEVLEERLDEMMQPRLVDALSNRKVFVLIKLLFLLCRLKHFYFTYNFFLQILFKKLMLCKIFVVY